MNECNYRYLETNSLNLNEYRDKLVGPQVLLRLIIFLVAQEYLFLFLKLLANDSIV